jgi:hypothetical protein
VTPLIEGLDFFRDAFHQDIRLIKDGFVTETAINAVKVAGDFSFYNNIVKGILENQSCSILSAGWKKSNHEIDNALTSKSEIKIENGNGNELKKFVEFGDKFMDELEKEMISSLNKKNKIIE